MHKCKLFGVNELLSLQMAGRYNHHFVNQLIQVKHEGLWMLATVCKLPNFEAEGNKSIEVLLEVPGQSAMIRILIPIEKEIFIDVGSQKQTLLKFPRGVLRTIQEAVLEAENKAGGERDVTLTDKLEKRREMEMESWKRLLAKNCAHGDKLRMNLIKADSHCLYRCVAQLVYDDESKFKRVRKEIGNHLMNNATIYDPFLAIIRDLEPKQGNASKVDKVGVYAQEIVSTSRWGGHLEQRIAADLYGLTIRVWRLEVNYVDAGKPPVLKKQATVCQMFNILVSKPQSL